MMNEENKIEERIEKTLNIYYAMNSNFINKERSNETTNKPWVLTRYQSLVRTTSGNGVSKRKE